jgi:NADH dehydrogenase FAD-containing subunit
MIFCPNILPNLSDPTQLDCIDEAVNTWTYLTLMEHRPAPPPFRYRHYGSLATIGRQAAVADFGGVRVRGAPAWWLWGTAHIVF